MRALAWGLLAMVAGACSRDLAVPAPRPLVLSPGASTIAPRERIAFAASGGAGGYAFAFAPGSPRSGADATLDAATGAYRAGSEGAVADTVVVTDAAGSTATATVTLGARLTISPDVVVVAPGGEAIFVAGGGLPPYAFHFQPKGNRSAGRIDGVTGVYTAGPNAGTEDKVFVVDAAGAVAAPASAIRVGPLHLPLPGGASELELADLNGDGRLDVVALEPAGPARRRITTTMILPGGDPVGETYFFTSAMAGISAADLTGDGRADLFASGSSTSYPFVPDFSGHLVPVQTLPSAGLARLPYLLTGTGISRVAWTGTAFDASAAVTTISYAGITHVGDLASGDFDASGTTEPAWLERDSYSGPVYGTGTAQLHYLTATPRLLPIPGGGLSAVLAAGGGARQQLVAGNLRGAGGTDLGVLLAYGDRNYFAVARSFTTSTAPAWATIFVDPTPEGPAALGVARCPALPGSTDAVVAWNGTAKPVVVAVNASGDASPSTAHTALVHVPITVAACGDVNGDGVPDLVAAGDSVSTMAIVWGDGDGGFGRRPHFRASPVYTTAEVDGDGVGDVVVATDAPSLVTLLGDEHQLALAAETPIAMSVAGVWAGDLGGAAVPGWRGDVVIADTASNLFTATGSPGGSFGRPAPLLDAPSRSARIPRIARVAFAELGGTAPGQDLLALFELSPAGSTPGGPVAATYELDAIIRDLGTSPRVITTTLGSFVGADLQPVDLDADGRDEVVFAEGAWSKGGPQYWRPVRLRVSTSGKGSIALSGALPSWTLVNSLPLSALGRSGDVAAFTSGGRAELVWDADFSWTTLPGGATAPGQWWNGNVRAPDPAALGAVTAPHGAPDLVFGYGGRVQVLPGVTSGGRLAGFGTATTAAAPGACGGILPQGAGLASDVLVFTGEELQVLRWDAAGATSILH